MPTHIAGTGTVRRAPEPPLQRSASYDALIEFLGDLGAEHVLVLGPDGPELMCALLRAGAPEVTHLVDCDRLPADSADIVVVPRVPSLQWLAGTLPAMRRALVPTGRLVLRSDVAGDAIAARAIRRLLARHGYCKIAFPLGSNAAAEPWMVGAEVPAFGLRKAA